jgi:hypothetical protein
MADDPKTLSQQANLEVLKQSNAELEKYKSNIDGIKQTSEQLLILESKKTAMADKMTILLQDEVANEKKIEDLKERQIDLNLEISLLGADRKANQEQLIKLQEKYGKLNKDYLKDLIEALELQREQVKAVESVVNEITNMTKGMGDFGTAVGKVGGAFTNAFEKKESFMELGAKISSLGEEGGMLEKFGSQLTTTFSKMSVSSLAFMGIAGMVIGQVFKMALAIDNASKDFQRSTGFQIDYADSMTVLADETVRMGITADEAAASFAKLSQSLSSFDKSNKKLNREIAKTVLTLEKFGVSSENSISAINFFEKSMGKTAIEAKNLTIQIATMGIESSITTTQMMDNFSQAKDRIALFGASSTRVLRDLSIQAKASGMSVSSLLGVTQQFDTFEGAADSVAKLNSVLGTNLSTIEMLEMDDAQRIERLREEVKARVGNFGALDKHTKLYIQNALGVKSVAEAQQLIDMNPSQYDEYNKRLEESAQTQEKLATQLQELTPLNESLKIAFNELLLQLTPLAIELVKVMSAAAKSDAFKKFIVVIGILGTALGVFIAVAKAAAFIMGLFGVAAGASIAPVLLAGAAVAALTAGLVYLWKIFHKDGSPMLYELPEHFGGAMGAMGGMAEKAGELLKKPIESLSGMWDIFHKSGSPDLYELPQTFADNFASIEQSVKGTMGSLIQFISVMKEFASLDYDGFVAVSSDGGSTSMVMGSDGIIKQMSEGKLQVDVNMPEIKMPPININVTFNDNKLKDLINVQIAKKVGRAG